MSCETNSIDYIGIVEDLIKLNPGHYKNFDNAVKFILKSPLTKEQQKLSIHNFAHIYSKLSEVDSDFYGDGFSKEVIGGVHLLDDNALYLQFISELFVGPGTSFIMGKGLLQDELDKLEEMNFIGNKDAKKLGSVIHNYFYLNVFDEEERVSHALEIKNQKLLENWLK